MRSCGRSLAISRSSFKAGRRRAPHSWTTCAIGPAIGAGQLVRPMANLSSAGKPSGYVICVICA